MSDAKSNLAYSSQEYDDGATSYVLYEDPGQIPNGFWVMENQLHGIALGDLTGLTVLDLGGGAGLRARQAIDHGAAAVDVVDCGHIFQPLVDRLGPQAAWMVGTYVADHPSKT